MSILNKSQFPDPTHDAGVIFGDTKPESGQDAYESTLSSGWGHDAARGQKMEAEERAQRERDTAMGGFFG